MKLATTYIIEQMSSYSKDSHFLALRTHFHFFLRSSRHFKSLNKVKVSVCSAFLFFVRGLQVLKHQRERRGSEMWTGVGSGTKQQIRKAERRKEEQKKHIHVEKRTVISRSRFHCLSSSFALSLCKHRLTQEWKIREMLWFCFQQQRGFLHWRNYGR